MQLAHGRREILHLRQNEVFEVWRIPDEGVGGRHPLHRRVEPRETVIGDVRGDLRAISPGVGVFVRDDDLIGLLLLLAHYEILFA